jgi:hypothetical protein
LKTCYVMDNGAVPALHGSLLTRVTPDNFYDIIDLYRCYEEPLALIISSLIPEGALLKFVEESPCSLDVIVYYTPGLVLLSRFGRVVMKRKPVIKPYPNRTSAQVLFEECKILAGA